MNILRFVHAVAFLSVAGFVMGQEDTAHHRAVYKAINDAEKSLKKVTGAYEDRPDYYALSGWLDGGEVRKIESKTDDDGGGYEEYYLENEKPLFVYNTYTRIDPATGKAMKRIENRLYFKNGELFKWLTNDDVAGTLHSEDYAAEGERLATNCAHFVAALKGKLAGLVAEGVFLGIEEGDYVHWIMRTKAGEELSFFILRPDASVDDVRSNPRSYIARPCRVTWKKSVEDIPGAGGKIDIEQVLSVEWLPET